MKKEIKIGKSKISFEIRKTTLKEKISALIVILIIVLLIYIFKKFRGNKNDEKIKLLEYERI